MLTPSVSETMQAAAIILAGGSGSRVQREINKVYLPIRDRPVLSYSLESFDASPNIGHIVLVVRDEDRDQAEDIVSRTLKRPTFQLVTGGSTRHESEFRGLSVLRKEFDLVAIHDGARPFVTVELLEALLERALLSGGAVPVLPTNGIMFDTSTGTLVDTSTLYRAQTPQVFDAPKLIAAYNAAARAGFTGVDTAETVERFSDLEIGTVAGDPRNIKLTFIEDFFSAEEYAVSWESGAWRQ